MSFSYAAVAVLCLAVGWLAGSGWAQASRAWHDYFAHKAQLPVLLALARRLSFKAAGWIALAVGLTAYTLHMLAQKGP